MKNQNGYVPPLAAASGRASGQGVRTVEMTEIDPTVVEVVVEAVMVMVGIAILLFVLIILIIVLNTYVCLCRHRHVLLSHPISTTSSVEPYLNPSLTVVLLTTHGSTCVAGGGR
ncbi:hypothetical protein VNO80_26936 [Phaseolus coccineus]|uniref:Uncharacterized protein n=1 Tax=Phaseolus coccineus TaxID=3886 RepID=A0AAN9LFM6_PHACN